MLLFLLISMSSLSQTLTISGYVQDYKTGEKLIGASIFNENAKKGTITNNYGFFSIELPSNNSHLKVSYVGYETKKITNLVATGFTIIELSSNNNLLQEVEVHANKNNDIAGYVHIPIEKLKNIPALLGEPDVIRALSYTPGISAGQEGTTGLYVRGGTPDQNLILLDEAPVYNAAHFGGFVSVFNPSSLKNIDVYKAGFPARYGGRLSSVLDIAMKDGNNKAFEGEASLGIIGSNVSLQGPLVKEKASFIISGRYSNIGLLSALGNSKSSASEEGTTTAYSFYDFNAKLNWLLTKKTQMFLSFFTGKDYVKINNYDKYYNNHLALDWGNMTGTFRISNVISPKVFGKLAIIYSKFGANQFTDRVILKDDGAIQTRQIINSESGVEDITGKLRFDIFPNNKISLVTGIDITHHLFSPSVVKTNYTTNIDSVAKLENKLKANEYGAYIEGEVHVLSNLTLNTGLRYTLYQVPENNYGGLEPRFNLNYQMGNGWSFKYGFSRMNQFINLLSNNSTGLPNDIWVPSTSKAPPQFSNQSSLGFYKKNNAYGLDISLECYYKSMSNLIDYPEGVNFLGSFDTKWDDIVIKNGQGRAYGIELSIAKNKGVFTGWIAYTLSKSERIFNAINKGLWYPSTYDRPHNLSIVGTYNLTKKWSINAVWIYQSGHALTLPSAAMTDIDGFPSLVYSGRNNQRTPDAHRLDLGFSRKSIGRIEKTLSLGLYNAYNHANPYALDVVTKAVNGGKQLTIKQYSLFSIIPSISYSIKF